MQQEYFTIQEFAKKFRVTPAAVHNWILKKIIYAIQLEKTNLWRIPAKEVTAYEERSKKETQKNVFERGF